MATEKSSKPLNHDIEAEVITARGRLKAIAFLMNEASTNGPELDPEVTSTLSCMIEEYSDVLARAFYDAFNASDCAGAANG